MQTQSRTPITDANIAAHEADVAARIASGQLSREAIYGDYTGARVRDIAGEMTDYILSLGSVTRDDLLCRFSSHQIDRWFPEARDRANRLTAGLH